MNCKAGGAEADGRAVQQQMELIYGLFAECMKTLSETSTLVGKRMLKSADIGSAAVMMETLSLGILAWHVAVLMGGPFNPHLLQSISAEQQQAFYREFYARVSDAVVRTELAHICALERSVQACDMATTS